MVSIAGYGSYLPLYRIERETIAEQYESRGRAGEITVPAHDENVLTMAVQAGKNAIKRTELKSGDIDAVYTASVSDPFEERGIAPHVSSAIGTGDDVAVGDFQSSSRAATNAILAARDAIHAGSAEYVLVVGSDVLSAAAGSKAEQTAGAGAAALVFGTEGDTASLDESAVYTSGFVGRFTAETDSSVLGDQRFERQYGYLDAMMEVFKKLETDADGLDPDSAIFPNHGNWDKRALSALDLDCDHRTTYDAVGYAGAASILLDIVHSIEKSKTGDELLVISYGPGGSDALLLSVGSAPSVESGRSVRDYIDSKEYIPYAKHREYRAKARGGDR